MTLEQQFEHPTDPALTECSESTPDQGEFDNLSLYRFELSNSEEENSNTRSNPYRTVDLKALANEVLASNRRSNHVRTARIENSNSNTLKNGQEFEHPFEQLSAGRAVPWRYVIADGKAEGVMICACSNPDEVTRFLERLHGGRVAALERLGGVVARSASRRANAAAADGCHMP